MLTKQEMQEELEKLRAQLKENNELMEQMALRADDMMVLRAQYGKLKKEHDRMKCTPPPQEKMIRIGAMNLRAFTPPRPSFSRRPAPFCRG